MRPQAKEHWDEARTYPPKDVWGGGEVQNSAGPVLWDVSPAFGG